MNFTETSAARAFAIARPRRPLPGKPIRTT